MGSRRNTRRVTGARPGGFILIQRCTAHDRLRFRGPQHHAPQSGTRRVPALRFRGIMKPFSALSSKLKIIRETASAHSSTSSALPSVATKIDQYPYASLRLRSNVVIGNTRAGRVPPPPQPCFARVLPINAKGFSGRIPAPVSATDPRTQADLSFLTRRLNSVWPTRTPHPPGYWDSLVDGSARRLGENHHRVAEDA